MSADKPLLPSTTRVCAFARDQKQLRFLAQLFQLSFRSHGCTRGIGQIRAAFIINTISYPSLIGNWK